METPLIEFRNVTKRFDGVVVLDGVDASMYENQITTIIGKSGTGKSVLLKHCVGLMHPDEGDILMEGIPVRVMKKTGKWHQYKRCISYMFQDNALFDSMTIFENVALPLRQTTRLKSSRIREKVMARIEQTELGPAVNKYPAELSAGMQKRVALARALVTDPKVVLFDEPTTGQDLVRRNSILSMIADSKKRFGFTAILISHDIPDIFFISDRILMLWEKKIIFQGTYEEAIRLEHPMIIELLQSLSELENEVTRSRYRQMFKSRYATIFGPRPADPTGVAVAYGIDYDVPGGFRQAATMAGIKSIEAFMGNYMKEVGGMTVRQDTGRMVTLIPHIDIEEARKIVAEFGNVLEAQTLPGAAHHFKAETGAAVPDIMISAGISDITPGAELEQILKKAGAVRQPIAHYDAGGGDIS